MITKNFIKQCEQAEELQKWYKSDVKNVCEGDRYICRCNTCKNSMYVHIVKDSDIDYINERDMTDVDPTCAAMVSLSGVGEFGAFWDDGGFIWLPAQERLQEMIGKQLVKLDGEISRMANMFFISNNNQILWNEFWLMYVMKEKYHKIWTGEKWVKVND